MVATTQGDPHRACRSDRLGSLVLNDRLLGATKDLGKTINRTELEMALNTCGCSVHDDLGQAVGALQSSIML